MIENLFTGRWILTTLLVVLAVGVMARLGFWQLDRLDQRRAFNSRVQAQLDEAPLDLEAALSGGSLVDLISRLPNMEYRSIVVSGEYDHSQEVALRNQVWEHRLGVRILTPLRINGTDLYILIDRGWVPYEEFSEGRLGQYAEPGPLHIEGMIRMSQTRPDIGRRNDPTPGPGGERLDALYLANVERIAYQTPYTLLPVYIQQAPDAAWQGPPYRSLPSLTLTEGSHMGYAIQWFLFAAILGFGYPFFVRKEIAGQTTKGGYTN
jgi:surfeit locus 1 family protein